MQDLLSLKIFELQKINNSIESCKDALQELEGKINYLDMLCVPEAQKVQEIKEVNDKNVLSSEKENLQNNLKKLETAKEKLNEELINSEDISQLIKIKYALLLSNYAVYHDNPTSKPKKEVKTLIQKLLSFNKSS